MTKRTECAICSSTNLKNIFSYGNVPLAGEFPKKEELGTENKYPLNFLFCEKCSLLQTDSIIDPNQLFSDYRYRSAIGLNNHFKGVAKHLSENLKLDKNSNILDIGCNDLGLLNHFKDLGFKYVNGIDPAKNIVESSKSDGIKTIVDFFDEITAPKYYKQGVFDLITCNNCFAHINQIHSVVKGIKYCLKNKGTFVFEVSYVRDLISKSQYDNMYHEHIFYYSLTALHNLFKQHGMHIFHVEQIPIHSGSIRVYVSKEEVPPTIDTTDLFLKEKQLGLTNLDYYNKFKTKVSKYTNQLLGILGELKAEKKAKIVGYGASGRANMIANACHLNDYIIDYIVDESPERADRYTSGTHIPIVGKDVLDNDNPDYVVIFAWNFADKIIEKLKDRNFKYIIPLPEPKIL